MAFLSIWENIVIRDSMFTTTYLIFSAYLLFLTQLTFAVLCANASLRFANIILINLVAISGSLTFYVLFGGGANVFDAYDSNPEGSFDEYMRFFLFRCASAVAAAGVAAAAVAGRTRLGAYLVFSIFIACFVYPVVAHLVWSSDGPLSPSSAELLFGSGAIDFAGSGVVHVVGGVSGLWGSLIDGPRIMGWFSACKKALPIMVRGAVVVVLGLCLLWFGFYLGLFGNIFVAYSSATANQVNWALMGRAAVVTAIAALTAGIVGFLGRRVLVGQWDALDAANGMLSGLVAISSGCPVVEPWAAVVCGLFAASILIGLNVSTQKLQFDDPLEAAQLHGGCGAWGLIFTGLFAKKELVVQAYSTPGESGVTRPFGLLMGGGWGLLAAQIIELLVVVGWVSVTVGLLFYILHKFRILRIPLDKEIQGLDNFSCNGGYLEIAF
ncbi:Ammonium transporter [Parasponia andersonii]|uniref:Ammonium transporter n=1 Tax=Parasponia andersonii TaxID=3476 RepID=A0A2P5CSX1_PARAD|nr:Ammonium transporter [Parasponia andersonii]